MAEEDGEDVEHGEATVDDVLEDLGARVTSDRSSFSVDGLGDRSLEDLLELE